MLDYIVRIKCHSPNYGIAIFDNLASKSIETIYNFLNIYSGVLCKFGIQRLSFLMIVIKKYLGLTIKFLRLGGFLY